MGFNVPTPTWQSFLCLLTACVLGLAGCSGMRGMEMGSSGHTTVFKELQTHDVTVTLEVPPVVTGQAAMLAVKVRENQRGVPIAGASVTFTIQGPTQLTERLSEQALALAEIQAEEVPQAGLYRLRHTFQESGPHEVTAKVRMRPEDKASSPLIVTAIQQVADPDESRKWLPVIGVAAIGIGIAMAAMMAAMIAAAAAVL